MKLSGVAERKYVRLYGKSYEPEPVNKFFVFLSTFFISQSLLTEYFLPAGPFAKTEGPRSKKYGGIYYRLAAQTPIRAH